MSKTVRQLMDMMGFLDRKSLESYKGSTAKLVPVDCQLGTWVVIEIDTISYLGDSVIFVPTSAGYINDEGPQEIRQIVFDERTGWFTLSPTGRKTYITFKLLSRSREQDC